MIRTIGQLLEELRDKEVEALEHYRQLPHAPIIGEMFEGVTKDILRKALFSGIDLRVASGFVRSADGKLSRQIDCMVVEGAGEPVPHTGHIIYPVEQVLAVVEVKTNLYGRDLADAHQNLLSVSFMPRRTEVRRSVVDRSFRLIVREELPDEIEAMEEWKQYIYHALVVEATQPARIALGHFGYKSEYALRKGLIAYLSDHETIDENHVRKGFGATSIPDLVLCRDFGLVKLNGLPYSHPITDDHFWPLIISFSGMPFTYLLEVLWTRISLRYTLPPQTFGEDLEMEVGTPLLYARAGMRGTQRGWQYRWVDADAEQLRSRPSGLPWEPTLITAEQAVFLQVLGTKGEINTSDSDFLEFLAANNLTENELLDHLSVSGIISRSSEGVVTYLTDECTIVHLPDGRTVAADARGGRLGRWLTRGVAGRA